ncbi:DNA methyltransferase [uncultured Marinobacter sp.]|mgnify:CR=1 FL=1|uniref:DNA methyltransferase n=1 Tax=uncultured Marinobacter sp. TaxID=187379 RepID=UPI002590760C|nr:DNA methyltransferase [uncultured Marinobacter sp.]
MTSPAEKTTKLQEFVDWVDRHIKGDEKGEAQVYLDRMFQAFGWPGLKEAGATCEERVKKTNGGTSFADLVWKPVIVIEMKKRGEDLSKHYAQAFNYWTRLVPNRPRYAMLCNFDEFWVYDFETQLDTPVDKVRLQDLANHYGPLNFLFPGDNKPVFGNHQETVTRNAADQLATCFNSLISRGVERSVAQRFILQILMALFAEDIGLLDKYFVTQLLEEIKTPQDAHDLLGGLFHAMNTEGGMKGGRYKGVQYFNGGLFSTPAYVELTLEEVELLREAAQFDWSKVRPEIFGTIFEHSLGKEERHARGAHFTSAVDIMKVIGPTIIEPWTKEIESASTLGRLKQLLVRIENFTVLDPACGSGNFLYIAYRELKRLEAKIYEKMATEYKSVDPRQRPFGFLSSRNFFGIDINPFAVDIAKVTMMLAHKLSIDELHINESALPLDNLDSNFRVGDALINNDGSKADWVKTDTIIGNPPFLGAKKLKPELGSDYVSLIRAAYPEVPGMSDFCVYWFRKAHDYLDNCTKDDVFSGRAGLVGTQNIRNNASRKGGLEYISATGTIVEAVDNQPWSGEANVHVAIVNWVKSQENSLLPKKRKLWFATTPPATGIRRPRGSGSAAKIYELDMREVPFINSSLSHEVDVSGASQLSVNKGFCYTGQYPRYNKGFVLSLKQGSDMLGASSKNSDVIHLFAGGKELLKNGKAHRYVIDFQLRSVVESQAYRLPFAHVKAKVLPYVERLAQDEQQKTGKVTGQDQGWLNTWWHHFRPRSELIGKISELNRYLVCSRVTKRPIFMFVTSVIRPSDALSCFVLDDDYSFGILQSKAHYAWFHAKCSHMKSDPRYTSDSVFATFPWPQSPSEQDVRAVAEAAKEVRQIRQSSANNNVNLQELYRTLDLPGKSPLKDAHEKLDAAVLQAYGFAAKRDLLQQLLNLNVLCSQEISAGRSPAGPGIPLSVSNPDSLISDDFIGL